MVGHFYLIFHKSRKLCTFPMSPSPTYLSKAAAAAALIFLLFSAPCLSDPRTSQAAFICNTNITAAASARSTFIANFQAAMAAITPIIAVRRSARVIEGSDNASIVYAFGQCMADLSQSDCDLCFAQCRIQILRCLPFQLTTRSGRNYLDGCYLRYDDYDFYPEVLSRSDTTACNATSYAGNRAAFSANVRMLIRNLTAMAPSNGGFYASSSSNGGNATNATAYGLAQCWEYVNRSSCRMCLENAASNITSCLPMVEGRSVRSGCYLRYSTYRFYNNSAAPTAPSSGGGMLVLS